MTFPQIIMLQNLQLPVLAVSHVDTVQQLIPSYNLWGTGNINRIAWSTFWKISPVSENMAHNNQKAKQTSLPPVAAHPIGIKIDTDFRKGKWKKEKSNLIYEPQPNEYRIRLWNKCFIYNRVTTVVINPVT